MSDDIKDDQDLDIQPKRGRGRPPKAKQKTPTSKEIEDAILEMDTLAVRVMKKLLTTDNPRIQYNVATKIHEYSEDIRTRRKEAGEDEQEEELEQKANGTTGGASSSSKPPVQAPKKLQQVAYLNPKFKAKPDSEDEQ